MEDIKVGTTARNKAEILASDMKETMETHKQLHSEAKSGNRNKCCKSLILKKIN
jgi:hypothetical protein